MLKNKTRIISIVFKDIDHVEDVDPNLRMILKTLVYIKWKGEDNGRFRKELHKAMPTRTTVLEMNDESDTVTIDVDVR